MIRPNVLNTIARIVLGVMMLAGGLTAFAMTPPPMPGMVGEFNAIFHASHWSWFVGAAQIAAGVFFLANRYVPIALIVTAAFLYNSLAFHLTMLPPTVILPIVVTALWVLGAWPYRTLFAPILQAKP